MPKQLKERVEIGRTPDGKAIYKWATGYSTQELHKCIAKILVESSQIEENHLTAAQNPITTPTFQQYTNEWMKLFKIPKLRHTTLKTYQNLLQKHIYPYFGKMRMSEITVRNIQDFYNQNAEMAKSSIRQMAIILHQIFAFAVDDGYMTKNLAESKRLYYQGNAEIERKALTDEEVCSIIANLDKLYGQEKWVLAIFLFTGIRRGEALALRWEDIDWKHNLISIHRSITFHNNQPVLGNPKSKAGVRKIPLDSTLGKILSEHRQLNGFIIGDGIEPLTERAFTRMWDRIKETIDLFGATPHVLRHTYITLCASSDMDVKTLQSIAGHADIRMTLDRYAHKREEKLIEAGEIIDKVFASIK